MLIKQRSASEVEEAVHLAIARVMEDRGLPKRVLRGDDRLNATLGLRSLDLAQLVFDLEVVFGADPFEKLVPVTSVRTVADVVAAYWRLAGGESAKADDAGELLDMRKANARRRAKRGLRA